MMKKNGWFPGGVLVVALLLRVVWILRQDNTVNVWTDWWDELACNLVAGRGYVIANPFIPSGVPYYSWRPPLFPLFLAGLYYLFGHSYLVAKMGLAVLSTVSVFLVYLITKEVFGKREACLASLLCAVYPTFIFFTGYLAPETLTMACLLSLVLSLLVAIARDRPGWWLLSGFWLGTSILCRTIMVMFFVFVLIWLGLMKLEKKKVWSSFCLLVIATGLTVSPWLWRNWRLHGVFLLHSTDSGQALYINNNPYSFTVEPSGTAFTYDPQEVGRLSELEATRLLSSRAIAFIRAHPGKFCSYVGRRFLNFWRPFPFTVSGPGEAYTRWHQILSLGYTGPIFVLALLGAVAARLRWRRLSLLYFLIFYYSGTYILVRAIIRYRMPLEPFLIILASHGWFYFLEKWKKLHEKMRFLHW
ncbi:MAG TPA: glycosyltransferase family 39 protein [bacterium]|nr:glycosyltransferase family 39 protein [bacterium]